MRTFKDYTAPTLEIVLITDDVIRTSTPGSGTGELPVDPNPWSGF